MNILDGDTVIESLVVPGNTGDATLTLDFTATGSNTTIEFVQPVAQGNGDQLIDNVSVTTTGAGLGLTPADTDGDGTPDTLQTDAAGVDVPPVSLNTVVTGLNTLISGTGVPGSTIVLTDGNGDPILPVDDNGDLIDSGTITVGADGTFEAIPATPLADDSEVTATQSDIPNVPGVTSEDTQTIEIDTDADGVRDTIDIDDDDDGILDTVELTAFGIGIGDFSGPEWVSTLQNFEINGTELRWTNDVNNQTQPDGRITRQVSGLSSLPTVTVDGVDYVQLNYDFNPELAPNNANVNFEIELNGDRIQRIFLPFDDAAGIPANRNETENGAILSENSATELPANESSKLSY